MVVISSTPTVRAFEPSDVLAVLNRDGKQVPHGTVIDQANNGLAWTAVLDDVPLACGGIVLLWPGVGSAWMMVSKEMMSYPFWLTRTVKDFLYASAAHHHLHRVETVALADSLVNQQWLEALGFVREGGVAHSYLTDKRSVVRYELVKGE